MMFFTKMYLILLLLLKYVDTSVVSDVNCTSNGDVYIRTGTGRSDAVLGVLESLIANSEGKVCGQEVTGDVVKLFGCLQPDETPYLDIFLLSDTQNMSVIRIECSSAETRRRRHRRLSRRRSISSDDRETTWYGPGSEFSVSRRRRQNALDEVLDENDEEIRNVQTSVTFNVKIDFDSNDEISIVCNPDGLGILYLSNPKPDTFANILSYSQLTRRKCIAMPLGGGNFVAIAGCSLNFPITVSFGAFKTQATIIGGTRSAFKVYNITCTDPVLARGGLFPAMYDSIGNSAVDNRTGSYWVVMMIMTLAMLC